MRVKQCVTPKLTHDAPGIHPESRPLSPASPCSAWCACQGVLRHHPPPTALGSVPCAFHPCQGPAPNDTDTSTLAKRALEQRVDSPQPVLLQKTRAGACELGVGDPRGCVLLPRLPRPVEPVILVLGKDKQRLVAQLGELGPPARAPLDRPIHEDLTHDVDFLAMVDLVPDALQHLPEQGGVAERAVHQPAHVRQAHIALLQLRLGQNAHASRPRGVVALKGEVHLLEAMALRRRTKRGLGSLSRATKENAMGRLHFSSRCTYQDKAAGPGARPAWAAPAAAGAPEGPATASPQTRQWVVTNGVRFIRNKQDTS